MTKRMIDADALLEWIKETREDEAKTMQVTEMLFQGYSRTVPYISEIALKNKVEELAENAEPDTPIAWMRIPKPKGATDVSTDI